jgi:hypothetical protein
MEKPEGMEKHEEKGMLEETEKQLKQRIGGDATRGVGMGFHRSLL